uniref:CSON001808 protein n=1 Tax=Culicoides sonorensis TaxID=179676 RepID=A0A336KGF5_CULSO
MNDIQRKLTYNTCLICGIRTSQLVNIFEEGRGGPNLVDVIYEKYNIKAENDTDKFLCYSCNNWLINWWSLQHKNDQTNNQPHSSSNSPSKSERNRNEKRYTSKTDKENEQRRPNFPVEGVVGKSRPVLAEAHHLLNVENEVSSTTSNETTFQIRRRQKPYAKKYNCSFCKLRFLTSSALRDHLFFEHNETDSGKYQLKMPNHSHHDTIALDVIDTKIVDMLRKQGTLITLEHHEDKTKPKPYNKQRLTKNEINTNEILLSFDTVITEAIFLGETLDTYFLSNENGLFVSP